MGQDFLSVDGEGTEIVNCPKMEDQVPALRKSGGIYGKASLVPEKFIRL